MIRRLIIATLIGLSLMAARPSGHVAAATEHPKWTLCTLHFGTHGGFISKQCQHIPMARETRRPVRKVWREIRRTPTLSIRVTWPVFEQPAPVSVLPGCPPAIAQWAAYIIGASRSSGLPVRAISGIIAIESGGNPGATNPSSGAAGLMQFLPSTAAALGINPYDPAQAIYAGAHYLAAVGAVNYSGGGYGWDLIYARGCD